MSFYWFWKNWSLIKRADGSDIWPIARAFFAGFTYFSLITDLNTQLAARGLPRRVSTAAAIGFLAVSMTWRLPDPYSLISVVGCLFVLPAVVAARELASEAALAEATRWRWRHTLLVILAVPFLAAVIAGSLTDGAAAP